MCITDRGGLYSFEPVPLPAGGAEGWEKENGRRRSTLLELNRLYNLDCMQGMKEFPDGFFDLAIVDPPYGIGIDGQRKRVCRNPKHNRKEHSREAGTMTAVRRIFQRA